MKLTEIEIGPHFLTVYGSHKAKTLELGRKTYRKFIRHRPELKDIQQKGFRHEPNDPRVYHPYGEPAELGRDPIYHFHVRYAYLPLDQDVVELTCMIDDAAKEAGIKIDASGMKFTYLEDKNPQGLKYPERICLDSHNEYLKSIEEIRQHG